MENKCPACGSREVEVRNGIYQCKKCKESFNILRLLFELIISLRAYAHSPKCDRIFSCPANHDLCKQNLDIDKAMSWEFANMVSSLYHHIIDYGLEKSFDLEFKLKKINIIADLFWDILNKHVDKYVKLAVMVSQVSDIITIIKEDLNKSSSNI